MDNRAMDEYECYTHACRTVGRNPMPKWRFKRLWTQFQKLARVPLDDARRRLPPEIPPALQLLADVVARGRELLAAARREDDDGYAAAGVRVPRTPILPALSGSAARPFPPSPEL